MKVLKNEHCIKNGVIVAVKKPFKGYSMPHRHDFFEIEYIVDGQGEYTVNGENRDFKSGMLFFMTPADFHTVRSDESEIINIMFAAECAEARNLIKLINCDSCCFELEEEHNRLFVTALLEEIIISFKESDLSFSLKLLSCLLDKLAILSKKKLNTPSKDVSRAVIYILSNFKNGITLEKAAAAAGFSPAYFSSVFKKEMGISFKKYLNNIQFDYAAKQLRLLNKSISEICFDSGFKDYVNFERRFKMKFGLSPKAYRVKNLEKIKVPSFRYLFLHCYAVYSG